MRKRIQLAAWYLLMVAVGCVSIRASEVRREYPLVSGWQFRQAGSGEAIRVSQWQPASVPGDVHLDLLHDGLIPDPFYRDNARHIQWIENADWEYRNVVRVSPQMFHANHLDLVFEGLDTNAQVYVNDVLVLTADNMFREWRVDARPHLRIGENTLRVVFPSPLREARRLASEDSWRVRTGASTPEKTYLRKAAYEYGWDWGPRLVTSGIWRAVHLETWGDARISNLYIHQLDSSSSVAHLNAVVEVTASSPVDITLRLDYAIGGGRRMFTRSTLLHAGVNHIDVPVEIEKPQLWYPAGYGGQPLYRFSASVSAGREMLDETSARVGIRTVVLRRDVDKWGRSFEFDVNGLPVFIKGASVVPFDSFPNRVTEADHRRILQAARDAHMNMVRQWGGGYYESSQFYDLCDELGIMVWQDFMFGNEWQPGTYRFKQNVQEEVEFQVRRLRNHPSVAIWCGNNETEASWKWPRTVDMWHGHPEVARQMWQNYLTLFSGVIAGAVNRLDPETPYWPSSPSADYEDTSGDFIMPSLTDLSQPQTYMSGDMHLYGIKVAEDYEKFFPRFMSEYGWLSFPDLQTIGTFTLPVDRSSIETPVMLTHQDGEHGNADILRVVRQRYGEPRDFASLVYLSQLAQAEWVKLGAEHLRRSRPRTMGALFWQLNDCWPGASLSSIDYDGDWKALQFYARRFYAPLLISPHIEDGSLAVYVVSDETIATQALIRLRVMLPDGRVLSQTTQAATVPPLSSRIFIKIPLQKLFAESHGMIDAAFSVADLVVDGKLVSQNFLFFDQRCGLGDARPDVRTELVANGKAYQLRLVSNMLARGVYISFGKARVKLLDNYINLVPNEVRVIDVMGDERLEQLRRQLHVISLADAVVPPPNVAASAPAGHHMNSSQ